MGFALVLLSVCIGYVHWLSSNSILGEPALWAKANSVSASVVVLLAG